jgi:hypothetical protein
MAKIDHDLFCAKRKYLHQLNQNHHEEGQGFIFDNPT